MKTIPHSLATAILFLVGCQYSGATSPNLVVDVDNGNSPFTLVGGTVNYGDLVVGAGNMGEMTQVNSTTITVHGNFALGFAQPSATGLYHLDSGMLNTVGESYIGRAGTGTLDVTSGFFNASSGGTVYVGVLSTGQGTVNMTNGSASGSFFTNIEALGYQSGSRGTLNQSKATHTVIDTLVIGHGGRGTYNLSGGTLKATGSGGAFVGFAAGSTGACNLSGTGTINGSQFIIGYQGVGTLMQTGGTIQLNGVTEFGSQASGNGTGTISGGTFSSSAGVNIGSLGTGQLTISGGTFDNTASSVSLAVGVHNGGMGTLNLNGTAIVKTNTIVIGFETGATGMITLSGNASLEATLLEAVGYNGTGTFTQSGGSHLVKDTGTTQGERGNLVLGAAGGTGTYNLSGAGSVQAYFIDVGGFWNAHTDGTGTFNQSGGTVTAEYLTLAANPATTAQSIGTYNLSGGICSPGTLKISQASVPQNNNMAVFNQTGGLLECPDGSVNAGGTYNLDGGTFAGKMSGGSGVLNLNGGLFQARNTGSGLSVGTMNVRTGGAIIDTNGFDLQTGTVGRLQHDTNPGAPALDGGLTKIGEGTLPLSAINTYTGPTTVNGGILQIMGSGTLGSSAPALAINNGATLDLGAATRLVGAVTLNDGIIQNGTLGGSSYTVQSGTISANLIGAGGQTLTKSTTGMVILSGTNTYNGGTFLNGGTLRLDSAGALGTSGAIDFGGGTLRYTASNTTDYSARILNSSLFVSIDTNGQNVTFASALGSSNTGGLFKVGAGTLTLASTNGYTGSFTRVTGGTLAISGPINGTTIVSANATLRGNGTLSGGLTVQNGGQVTSNGGTMAVTAPVSIATNGVIRFTGGATFDASGATSLSNSGLIDVITGHLILPATYSGAGTILTREVVKIKTHSKAGTTVNVAIDSHTGHIYHLQKTTNLTQPFVDVCAPQNGATGTTLNFTDPNATEPSAFYRFEVE